MSASEDAETSSDRIVIEESAVSIDRIVAVYRSGDARG
jgi:hypothetical protein